jgi:arginine exporter protein ArgO
MIPSPPKALDDEDLARDWLATNTCSSWTKLMVVIAKSTFSCTLLNPTAMLPTFFSIEANWDVSQDRTSWMFFSDSALLSTR